MLRIDPVTATRRWQAITEAGLARITAYPSVRLWARDHCTAFIELDVAPADREEAIGRLRLMPEVASISNISSGRYLFLTVLTRDLATLSDVVLRRLATFPGLRRTRTSTATTVYGEGNRWRLPHLTAEEQSKLAGTRAPQSGVVWQDRHPEIFRALRDGRRSAAEIAAELGHSQATVRRRLTELIDGGLVSLRCEVAQRINKESSIAATFWARVPPDQLADMAGRLAALPEVRLCAAVTGADNLIMTLWVRSLARIQQLEAHLAEEFPTLTLTDRAVTLRAVKRMGCLLDDAGTITEVIPIDPWAGTG